MSFHKCNLCNHQPSQDREHNENPRERFLCPLSSQNAHSPCPTPGNHCSDFSHSRSVLSVLSAFKWNWSVWALLSLVSFPLCAFINHPCSFYCWMVFPIRIKHLTFACSPSDGHWGVSSLRLLLMQLLLAAVSHNFLVLAQRVYSKCHFELDCKAGKSPKP